MDPRLMIGPQGPQLGGIALKSTRPASSSGSSGLSFNDLFNQIIRPPQPEGLRISAHAQKRLDERNIIMNEALENSISKAINELAGKGAKDSLIVTREAAFLVNVPNRTVVTAMGLDEMRDGIVTNIDSVSMKYR